MLSKYLGDKPFWKSVTTLALPMALQALLSTSFTLVDTVMVGQLGDISLSAVGMAGQWSWLMVLVFVGICSGTGVFVSQYWGVGNVKGIRRVLGISTICVLAVSLIFFAVGAIYPRFVLKIFSNETPVIEEGIRYLRSASFSYIAIGLMNLFSTILRSVEIVKVPMYSSFVASLINVVMNYSLIFGKFGLPEMGIKGAALATCISSWTGLVILLIISLKQKNILIGRIKDLFEFTKSEVAEFMRTAMPVVVNEGMWGLGTFTYNIIFGRLGYENYAAVTMVRTLQDLSFAIISGLGAACCVIVGKSIGAGLINRGYNDSRRFAVLVPLISFVSGIIVIVFRNPFIRFFDMSGNMTAYTLKTTLAIIVIVGLEMAVRNVAYINVVGIFRSGGDTKTGLKYDMICLWGVSLPLTFLAAFVFKWSFPAVFATMLIAEDVPKTVMCIRYFVSKKWIRPVTEEGKEALKKLEDKNNGTD